MLVCGIVVDGFNLEFENRTCSLEEDCPNATACIDHHCQERKIYGNDCQDDKECLEELTCEKKKCYCRGGKKWLRTRCVYPGNCDHNSDCPDNHYCDMYSSCAENGLKPAQQGLITFAILLFLTLASTVLYLTVERKIRRRKWKAEKIEYDGELSENQSRFDIDDEQGK